jgi:hypothetical protein
MAGIHPTIDAPDEPPDVVGALSLPDLSRFERSPAILVFVVAAVVVALGRGASVASYLGNGGSLETAASAAIFAATETILVVLPAALLWRIPAAPRTHPVLLGGLGVGALVEVLRLGASALATSGTDPSVSSILGTLAWLIVPVGSLLVGRGLLRLRASWSARRGLLVVIAFLYLALRLVPLGAELLGNEVVIVTWLFPVTGILVPITAALAGWVAVDAWLDGQRPTVFWGLLALGVPLYVISALVSSALPLPALLALPADPTALNSLTIASATAGEILA